MCCGCYKFVNCLMFLSIMLTLLWLLGIYYFTSGVVGWWLLWISSPIYSTFPWRLYALVLIPFIGFILLFLVWLVHLLDYYHIRLEN